MGKLDIGQRRLIAIYFQHDQKSEKWICARGFSRTQVSRWKNVHFLGRDALFNDQQRLGRPHLISEAQELAVMRKLESDIPAVVVHTAKAFNCSVTTIQRIAGSRGRMVSCHMAIHISDDHAVKRVGYSHVQKGQDHTKKCWIDHTLLSVPPDPSRQRVWRAWG